MNNTEIESLAFERLINWLKERNEWRGISILDNRRQQVSTVNADIVATGGDLARPVFIEVKSTKAKERYWGRIVFGEILDALDAEKKGYDYYFAIVKIDKSEKGFSFIFPKNIHKEPFLSLEEMLRFTNGKYSYGIDFIVKYKIGKKNEFGDYEITYPEESEKVQPYKITKLIEQRWLLEKIAQDDRT